MTRMHSSRMRTACSSSHWGVLPQCMLGCTPLGVGLQTPQVWAWRPLHLGVGCGPGDPPGCGPGDHPSQTPQLPPWLWAWRSPWPDPSTPPPGCGPGHLQGMLGSPWRPAARHAAIPPAMHAGIPPPCEQNYRHTCVKT